uniref:Protein kinase domain-containing protein n=1 Tax=Chromera velia CCMP2878 TaxID=1169474 RepID=A0A0G4G422_9ALVE|eukprot:Cvel_20150.t1-p1 / transcript=Cvel_20150.t1 / gene=Cvel_20150 / organism=Chromera_velia_CCMP2878 / gene_product=Probable serine/threonine-protein kinase fhkC, putative / transcript_product=Probable serine/threonine-protein kinase fhkC, putative / location=Cvel_scaffold1789:654-12232(-) / protein_length=1437 / sequence_SO=supercontig / SO=protein_coding / is_pseudo=false
MATSPSSPSPEPGAHKLPPLGPGRRFENPDTGHVYELGEQLGAGAAAVVFKCLLSGTDPPEYYAVKVIDLRQLRLKHDMKRERTKLKREVGILRSMRHPCIVNLVEVLETRDELFLVMELVEGGELFYKIVDKGTLSEDQARYVFFQVLEAVRYMHSHNVIHRDLKPENILVSGTTDAAGNFFKIKVADFGLAKLVKEGYSVAKTFVGTPQYWAPEVIEAANKGTSYTSAADMWSLGVLLYVMLGGTYPFDTRTGPVETLIANGSFHFRYASFKKVSAEAKNLISGLMTVNPDKRLKWGDLDTHPWLSAPFGPEVPPLPPLMDSTSATTRNSGEGGNTPPIHAGAILGGGSSHSHSAAAYAGGGGGANQRRHHQQHDHGNSRRHHHQQHPPPAAGTGVPRSPSPPPGIPQEAQDGPPAGNYRQTPHQMEEQTGSPPTAPQPAPPAAWWQHRVAEEPQQQQQQGHAGAPGAPQGPGGGPGPGPYGYPYGPYPPYWGWPPPPGPYWPQPGAAAPGAGAPQQQGGPETQNFAAPPGYPPPVAPYYYPPSGPPPPQQQKLPAASMQQAPAGGSSAHESPGGPPGGERERERAPDGVTTVTVTSPDHRPPEKVAKTESGHLGPAAAAAAGGGGGGPGHHPKSHTQSRTRPGQGGAQGGDEVGGNGESAARQVFNLNELYELQVSIATKFQLAYMAFRHHPVLARKIKHYAVECRTVQHNASAVITKFGKTCQSVLALLPDLELAVDQDEPALAIGFLEDVRKWVGQMKKDAQEVKETYSQVIRDVNTLVESARDAKRDVDSYVMSVAKAESTAAIPALPGREPQGALLGPEGSARGGAVDPPTPLFALTDGVVASDSSGGDALGSANANTTSGVSVSGGPGHPAIEGERETGRGGGVEALPSCPVVQRERPLTEESATAEGISASPRSGGGDGAVASPSPPTMFVSSSSSSSSSSSTGPGSNQHEAVGREREREREREGSQYDETMDDLRSTVKYQDIRERLMHQLRGLMTDKTDSEDAADGDGDEIGGRGARGAEGQHGLSRGGMSGDGGGEGSGDSPAGIGRPDDTVNDMLDLLFMTPGVLTAGRDIISQRVQAVQTRREQMLMKEIAQQAVVHDTGKGGAAASQAGEREGGPTGQARGRGAMQQITAGSSSSLGLVPMDDSGENFEDQEAERGSRTGTERERGGGGRPTQQESLGVTPGGGGREREGSGRWSDALRLDVALPAGSPPQSVRGGWTGTGAGGAAEDVEGVGGKGIHEGVTAVAVAPWETAVAVGGGAVLDPANAKGPDAKDAVQHAVLLATALQELRKVDLIIARFCDFWANMDSTIERLSQMKDHTERLVSFAHKPKLRERFNRRLAEYSSFWMVLAELCTHYVEDVAARSAKIYKFINAVDDQADQLDSMLAVSANLPADQRREVFNSGPPAAVPPQHQQQLSPPPPS